MDFARIIWLNGNEERVPLSESTTVLDVRKRLAAAHQRWNGQVKLCSPSGVPAVNSTRLRHEDILNVVLVPFAMFALGSSVLVEVDAYDGTCLNDGWQVTRDMALHFDMPAEPGCAYAWLACTSVGEDDARRITRRNLVKMWLATKRTVVSYMELVGEVNVTAVICRKGRFLLVGLADGIFVFNDASGEQVHYLKFHASEELSTMALHDAHTDGDLYVGLLERDLEDQNDMLHRFTLDANGILTSAGKIATGTSYAVISTIIVLEKYVFITSLLDPFVRKFDRSLSQVLDSFPTMRQRRSQTSIATSCGGQFIFYRTVDGVLKRRRVEPDGGEHVEEAIESDALQAMCGTPSGLIGISIHGVMAVGNSESRPTDPAWCSEETQCLLPRFQGLSKLFLWSEPEHVDSKKRLRDQGVDEKES